MDKHMGWTHGLPTTGIGEVNNRLYFQYKYK